MSPDPNKICSSLLQHIRDSGLNFICQETPWSIYLTLRKSLVKSRTTQVSHSVTVNQEVKENLSAETELNLLKVQFQKLSDNYKHLEATHKEVKKILRTHFMIVILKLESLKISTKQMLMSMRKLMPLKKRTTGSQLIRKSLMIK